MKVVGEEAIDTGGPRREFWNLLVSKGEQEYCIGERNQLTFVQNTAALQVFVNKRALSLHFLSLELKHFGMYVAMSIVQGGRGFPVLHTCVYNYMWSGKYIGGHMTDDGIMQSSIRSLVEEVFLFNIHCIYHMCSFANVQVMNH